MTNTPTASPQLNQRCSRKVSPQVIFATNEMVDRAFAQPAHKPPTDHKTQQNDNTVFHSPKNPDIGSPCPPPIILPGTPVSIPRFVFSSQQHHHLLHHHHHQQQQRPTSAKNKKPFLSSSLWNEQELCQSPSPPGSPMPPESVPRPRSGKSTNSNNNNALTSASRRQKTRSMQQNPNTQQEREIPTHHSTSFPDGVGDNTSPPNSPPPPLSPAPPSSLPTPTTQQSLSLPPSPRDSDDDDNKIINSNIHHNDPSNNILLNAARLNAYFNNEFSSPFPSRHQRKATPPPRHQHQQQTQLECDSPNLWEPVAYSNTKNNNSTPAFVRVRSRTLSMRASLTRNQAKELSVKQTPKHNSLSQRVLTAVTMRFWKL